MKTKKYGYIFAALVCITLSLNLHSWGQITRPVDRQLLTSLHSISSHDLYDYVAELTSDKYAGRLTGTKEYDAAAAWVAEKFRSWNVKPGGDNGNYYQHFDIPYTLVFEGCRLYLHIPYKDSTIRKYYSYDDEFIPGSTSGSGEITAEVIYAGYGITAPELGYDDYAGIDVEGKIILIDREVPVSTAKAEVFKKWRPYSFHQYKLLNAVRHGARGMLYNYGPIGNPNNAYHKDFIYTHVGSAVVADLFSGTGRDYGENLGDIGLLLKPHSFNTGKVVTIKNVTEHHPDGRGSNVIGLLEGTDPKLKDQVIIIGGHLDHLGRCWEIMPGANDNASAVAVILGVARALAESPIKLKRSVMFLCFGAEEQAVYGSEYYLKNPKFPLEKTVGLINMDGVGCGDRLNAQAAQNYPAFWEFIRLANDNYIHRTIRPSSFANIARPRLDAARFMWAGVPTLSFSSAGAPSFYHNTHDDLSTITPEIMEDLAQLIFLAVTDIANADNVDFRKNLDSRIDKPMNLPLLIPRTIKP